MIKDIVSWIISKVKHHEYQVDEEVNSGDLIVIVTERLIMSLRGLTHKYLFKKAPGILFIGGHVKIRAHRNIECGSGMTIEDGCFINGLCKQGVTIGRNFSLGRNGILECTGVIRELGSRLTIGDNVGIAANAFISVRGPVTIGDNTIMGPGVKIFAENHRFSERGVPIYLQGARQSGVTIGEDCWIGANAVLLDGVHVGNHVVVAAGAVVTQSVPDYAVVGGVPARILKLREA